MSLMNALEKLCYENSFAAAPQ